jgi:hypothetical protein
MRSVRCRSKSVSSMGLVSRISILVAVAAAALYWRLNSVGAFREVRNFEDKWNCSRMFESSLGQGSEDFVPDENGQFVIISSSAFGKIISSGNFQEANGCMFRVDLNSLQITQLQLRNNTNKRLAPHGVDLVKNKLFVVGHADDGDCVYVYRLQGNEAVLEKSVCSPLIVSPNAIAGREDGSFFVVNDHSRSQGSGVIRFRSSSLLFHLYHF